MSNKENNEDSLMREGTMKDLTSIELSKTSNGLIVSDDWPKEEMKLEQQGTVESPSWNECCSLLHDSSLAQNLAMVRSLESVLAPITQGYMYHI